MEKTIEPMPSEDDVFNHVFSFSWIPLKEGNSDSVYKVMGEYGTISRITKLILINSIAIWLGLLLLIGGNPYIPLADALYYIPFNIAFIYLGLFSFLVSTTVHFLCFRLVSGKGSLVAHGYISALISTNLAMLYWLTIIILFVTRIRGIDNVIIILGNLYLLYPSLLALRAIHNLSSNRLVAGFLLTIGSCIPLFILHLYLLNFLREARPYNLYDWRSMLIFISMGLVMAFILTYMYTEQRAKTGGQSIVSILAPVRKVLHLKSILLLALIIPIGFLAAFFVFNWLNPAQPAIKTEKPPYLISFLPEFDPDLMFVLTRDDPFRKPTQLEIWRLSSNKRIETIDLDLHVARLRPSEDGLKLILSNRQSPHGDALIYDPETGEFSEAKFDHLKRYGILNPYQNDIYYTSSFGGVHVERDGESETVRSNKRYLSVSVHPDNNILFFTADGFIDVMDIETLEVIDTIRLGGNLKDLAVTPDGSHLYITDALWNRVIIIPYP